jgi:hypothetical protein
MIITQSTHQPGTTTTPPPTRTTTGDYNSSSNGNSITSDDSSTIADIVICHNPKLWRMVQLYLLEFKRVWIHTNR